MKKKILLIGTICFLVTGLMAGTAPGEMFNFEVKGDGVGYTLLNEIVDLFKYLSSGKGGTRELIETNLFKWWHQVEQAKNSKLIDETFYTRYKNLLVVITLCTLKPQNKVHPIVDAIVYEAINKFDLPKKENVREVNGLGSIAEALSQEMFSLKKYLDNKTKSKKK